MRRPLATLSLSLSLLLNAQPPSDYLAPLSSLREYSLDIQIFSYAYMHTHTYTHYIQISHLEPVAFVH